MLWHCGDCAVGLPHSIEIDLYDDEDDHDFNRTVPNATKYAYIYTHIRSIYEELAF